MTSSVRQLFGGAITVTLPSSVIDASDLREVPDTQEVFLYPDSSVSIIVDVLQRVEAENFADAARLHFASLAHDNDAESSTVHDVGIIPNDRGDNTPSPVVLYGTQSVKKFNQTVPDEVRILLALYRVKDKNVDLLLTCNVPVRAVDQGAVGEEGFTAAKGDFDRAVQTLRIVDFGLFA
ncbi:Mog1p/PsbP-like protein [Gloeophyllum trabeum ATCC 11539]|uniref:Mog1p/PsbP-like protein n=1 Tax=Gloeophyllum trabeum (strain ATCC 11539 / FP-39264 / Madison 617) TaxID=670483 RepID=S7QF30_GLOTA|nr:Mog1p/PsbP-like protein [Gloeophyllum trabeum ATCC 11539]EPQ58446.1 Mog1p/PsbP-like protein [Gloeophyllum trabeum ATCC 11539]